MPVCGYLSRDEVVQQMPLQAAATVRAFDLALEAPFRIAYDTVTHARNVLVARPGEGAIGWGEGAPVPTITGEDQATVLADLVGPRPITRAGLCATDTAAWDLRAREAGQPLCTALTGAAPRHVETSITIPLVPDAEVEPLVQRRLREGFSIFKVKAGLDVEQDLARLQRIRHAVGERELRVDANQGWSLDDATRALPQLAALGIEVLEQPLAKADLEGHARLCRLSERIDGPPIMLDESVFDAADASKAIDAGAAHWINIKLQKSGGLTEALRIAELAQDNDVPCMVGCMLESRIAILHGAHLVAAHPNILKADLDGAFLLRDDPVHGGAPYDHGRLLLDGRPGIGVGSVEAA